MVVIFLDCDGVLNCQYSESRFTRYVGCDDDKLERLKRIVDATGAKIVVSSTWRLDVSRGIDGDFWASGIYQYLLENLQKYDLDVYDITPVFSYHRSERGREIYTWLQEHKDLDITDFVILDDEWFYDFDYPEYNLFDRVVQTSFYMKNGGLQDEDVEKAIFVLNGGTVSGFAERNK